MALTILPGYTDQQVQLNILEFCDLTGPTILAILHIFLVCFSGDTYGVTSSSSSWSYRPEPNLIGVSVFKNQNQFSLRFHIRNIHLDQIKNPKTVGIRGLAQNGFVLTPDSNAGVKPSRIAKSDLFYVMQTVTKFDLSKRERRTVWMRPEFENGHLRIPPLPPAWINVEVDFMPGESSKEEGARTMAVSRNGNDDGTRAVDGSRAASSSATVPPPRPPSPSYQLPTDTELTRLQIELAQKLEEARALVQQMERLSGLRLVLDRNLRLVVNLTPLK